MSKLGAQIGRILVNRNHPEWLERLGQFERGPIHRKAGRECFAASWHFATVHRVYPDRAMYWLPSLIRRKLIRDNGEARRAKAA